MVAETVGSLYLENARLIDGTGAKPRASVTVEVREGRIAAIVEAGSGGGIPRAPDATVFDCAGRTLLPGLIDAHAHATSAGEVHPDLRAPDAGDVISWRTAWP